MLFHNENDAKSHLINLNYYRLSGYWLPYKNEDDSLHHGIYFEDIIRLYKFDGELKTLCYNALETIEISVRTKFAYYMAKKYGAHPLKEENFKNKSKFQVSYKKLCTELARKNQHIFVEHYNQTYKEDTPPIWVSVEVITFGALSQFIKNIADVGIKKEIANSYNLDIGVLDALLYHLATLRNDIAHHSRVYNKVFKITPKLPKFLAYKTNPNSIGYLYNTIVLCDYILTQIEGKSDLEKDVLALISKYNIDKYKMGYLTESNN